MTKDILRGFGPDSPANQKPRATHGGVMPVRDVRNYSPPQGPRGINDAQSPGLKGVNAGNRGTQFPPEYPKPETGKVGIGATHHGNCGTQGKH